MKLLNPDMMHNNSSQKTIDHMFTTIEETIAACLNPIIETLEEEYLLKNLTPSTKSFRGQIFVIAIVGKVIVWFLFIIGHFCTYSIQLIHPKEACLSLSRGDKAWLLLTPNEDTMDHGNLSFITFECWSCLLTSRKSSSFLRKRN